MNQTNYNLTMGASLQRTFLTGELMSLSSSIDRSFQNFLPVARLNIDFNDTRHLEVHYETSVQEPSIQELQPVIDNSDPLNLYQGNPALRPAYEHSLRMEFANFDQARLINVFAFVEGTMTQHAITTSQQITGEQIRISQPVNVSGRQQLNSDVTFGFPINKIKSRFSISGNASLVNSVNILNESEQNIRQQQFGGRVRYDFRYKEVLDLGLSANITKSMTHYEFSSQADQQFMNQTYRAEGILSFLKNYQLTSSIEYLVYQNATVNFTQQIPLLNISMSRFVMKNKTGEIKIAVTNLINRNIGVSQSSNINYVERTTANSLGRYFMLSFTYALNKFMNPLAGRPGGRQIRIMR
jgi:hypothetical protein